MKEGMIDGSTISPRAGIRIMRSMYFLQSTCNSAYKKNNNSFRQNLELSCHPYFRMERPLQNGDGFDINFDLKEETLISK